MINTIKKFAINATSGWFATIAFTVVGLILMPYIISHLGMRGYGIYQLANSALSFFMFLHLGMGPALVRFFSKAIARNEKDELGKVNSTAQLLLGGLGMFGCLIIMVLIPVFIRFYEIPNEFLKETIGLLICMGISLFFNLCAMPSQGIICASNRYDLVNIIEIGNHLLRLVVIFILFELVRPSIFFVGLSILLSQIFRFTALLVISIRHAGRYALFSFAQISKESVRSILGFSVLNLTNSIAATIFFQGPVLVVGKLLGPEMAAAFSPALIVSRAMQGILGQTTRPLVPVASQDRERNGGSGLGKWAISAGQLAAFVGFGITLPLLIFGPELMKLWLGENLVWTWPIVAVMSSAIAISEIQSANYFLAIGGGQIYPSVCSQVVLAILILTGMPIGMIFFNWELISVAFYIAVCSFARSALYLPYAYSIQFSYNYISYLWAVYGLPALLAAVCVFAGLLLKSFFPVQNFLVFMCQIIITVIFYIIICWLFLLPKEIKNVLISFFIKAK